MSETKKNPVGRPPVNATPITVRVPPDLLEALDRFAAEQKSASRPEAIRALVQDGLIRLGFFPAED